VGNGKDRVSARQNREEKQNEKVMARHNVAFVRFDGVSC
jgi:hypothetical protein